MGSSPTFGTFGSLPYLSSDAELIAVAAANAHFRRESGAGFREVRPAALLAGHHGFLVTSALEAYLSVQSNRMNEIMKTLTLIATVMLPITFIAGVYGMNFKVMPELDWPWGYAYALGLMGAVTVVTMVWFWKKGWIGSRELDIEEE